MIRSKKSIVVAVLLAGLAVHVTMPPSARGASDDKRKEELQRKLEELRRKKAELEQDARKKLDRVKKPTESLSEVIARYERLYNNCQGKKNQRCADVMYTLSKLYYDQARDQYIQARNDYEKKMDEWDKNPRGPEPVNPTPDYSKALRMYEQSTAMYPDFEKADEGYYQIGTINMILGNVDESKDAFKQVVSKFPNSIRASAAHFRLADYCFMDRDFTCALKHIERIKPNEVNLEVIEMSHYRKAEIYYNRAEFDKAAKLFFEYIEKCDAGQYQKKDLRGEALEYLAICFSDMPNGGEEAVKFFKREGSRPYEDYVLYTVGMKNFNHGQYDDAILSLKTALRAYPYYADAPTAQQMLVACYVIKKKYKEANEERERLVDYYYKDGEWASRNSSNRAAIENAANEVRRALGQIAIYYHAEAQKKKKRDLFEKALKRYNEFFTKFPDDVWRVYEYKYNVAEIYNELKNYEMAAKSYDYVAQQNLSTYPAYKPEEDDTLGLDEEEKERLRQEKGKKSSPVSISQEDAGYNAIVAYDNLRKQKMAAQGLSDQQAYSLPETQQLFDYIHAFQQRFPKSPTAPEVLYLGGNIHYAAKAYDKAIAEFKLINDTYPSSKFAGKSLRMLANSYASSGEYEMALSTYQRLLSKEKPGTQGYNEIVDLAAGAMFKKAEGLRKGGNLVGAADAFKAVYDQYPKSKAADRAWFEAGMCYEEANSLELAAQTFASLGDKFPQSDLREKSYVRAAEDYKKLNRLEDAAKTYELAASKVAKPDYAIPSLSSASECYKKANMYGKAGQVSEVIYQKYPTDSRTPLALYNAGLIYEKGKLYTDAIRVYRRLAEKYPQSEYASEGYYSIGYCYQKQGKKKEMADAFSAYAEKFTGNKSKQVMALVKAAEAYYDMNNVAGAEKTAQLAAGIFERYRGKADVDIAAASRAYYLLGEIKFKAFDAVSLKGNSERAVEKQLKAKTEALEPVLKAYAKAIELGVGEWTIRSTYRVGESFVAMAEAYRNQSLFGTKDQQLAAKIKIISGLEKYYLKAAEKFEWNINTAYEQGIVNKWVDMSEDMFMKMLYLNGHLFEEVGQIFKNAPIPRGLTPEEQRAYKDVLEEKNLEALDKALPKYEAAVQAAANLGIAKSPWLDKIRERVRFINPASQMLTLQITPREPKPGPASASAEGGAVTGGARGTSADETLRRNLERINNIMEMRIPASDKLSQLRSIENDAKRAITREKERIEDLKIQLGLDQ
ncbi:MAG: tetratricopeptide repeat protein [Chitinivibrionales bacterium]|nr:tetratricopeptide repeat protein [Chitinivibrionales bacterium]